MMAANPRLIYCSMPGFGHDDPRAQLKAWEGVLAAATCAFSQRAGTPRVHPPATRPVYTVIPFSSCYAAFLAAVSVAILLNARQRSGVGQWVEIPLFDATFTAIGTRGMRFHKATLPSIPFVWSRHLPTKDGRWFMYVHGNKRFEEFIREIGLAEYRDAGASPEELGRRFDEVFRKRTALEWEKFCEEVGTEGGTCNSSAEWLQHPQALGSKIVDDFDDPELGRFRGPGITPRLSETPGQVRSPRPRLDAHREEILKELLTRKTAQGGAEKPLRSALQGLKVIDLCLILAGPTCGRTLAEFGADVIKIDSPHRDPVTLHNDINRAKRSILLDLKTPEGLQIFWQLLDQADVVLQNFRKGVADRLGIGYEDVKKRRPGIIYCSLNTFGQLGPYAGRPGHEQIAQAVSGMQFRYGGDRPALAPYPANDYGTGLLGAYAVALALLHRNRTGKGQHVDSALAYTATMLQSALLQDYPGKQWNEPAGQDALGKGPLYRAYQAGDGWLFLAAKEGELAKCAELKDLAGTSGTALEQALEARMKTNGVDAWVSALTRAGVGAHRILLDSNALMEDALVVKRGLSITREHDELGPVTTTGPAPRLSRTPLVPGRPAPKPGSDAWSILAEIGLGGEVERLVRERVIAVDGVGTLG
jgi:crotonobetainyl-CoA:carnitine CoA-transferase CaiB-like acyl-CoA transferase